MKQGTRKASQIVEERVKALNLVSFPCGKGKWRNEELSDYNVNVCADGSVQESLDELHDYANAEKSPWAVCCSWSDEAQPLRDVAIQWPGKLDNPDFVRMFLRTLRLVGEKIEEVDEGLLAYENLKELSLSCNLLETVASRHLPRQLEVLELCSNEILNPRTLCPGSPPSLYHVGLGYNCLHDLSWLLPIWWPQLLSLDLSHNHLVSLPDITSVLRSLPKLRNLVLLGNPVSLVPAYRPYVIEKMPELGFLDDMRIIPDDRARCKEVSDTYGEEDLSRICVTISINQLHGVPPPPTDDIPSDPNSEKIEHYYYVEYDYVQSDESPSTPLSGTAVLRTEELAWANEVVFNYSVEHLSSHLDKCCSLLLSGIPVRIIAARVVSVAIPDEENPACGKTSKPPKGDSSGKKSGKTPPSSTPKNKAKSGEDKKRKAGKKSLESDLKWNRQPPELKCLLQEKIYLESLLSSHYPSLVEKSMEFAIEKQRNTEQSEDKSEDKSDDDNGIASLSVTVKLRRHPVVAKLQRPASGSQR
eukprot:m.60466 g.60466  ORF g.60466 m.60466 type:complete len:529 (+) comp34930_c0_seq2:52-1638(+)